MKITTWQDADRAMEQLAAAKASLDQIVSLLESEKARLAQSFGERVSRAEGEIAALEGDLTRFAKVHKKDFRPRDEGGDTRSYEHAGVVIGFRTMPPKVHVENEDAAITYLRISWSGMGVREKYELDRVALAEILQDDADPCVEKLIRHGITLQQKDRVFVEVKSDAE